MSGLQWQLPSAVECFWWIPVLPLLTSVPLLFSWLPFPYASSVSLDLSSVSGNRVDITYVRKFLTFYNKYRKQGYYIVKVPVIHSL